MGEYVSGQRGGQGRGGRGRGLFVLVEFAYLGGGGDMLVALHLIILKHLNM